MVCCFHGKRNVKLLRTGTIFDFPRFNDFPIWDRNDEQIDWKQYAHVILESKCFKLTLNKLCYWHCWFSVPIASFLLPSGCHWIFLPCVFCLFVYLFVWFCFFLHKKQLSIMPNEHHLIRSFWKMVELSISLSYLITTIII